MKKFEEEVKRPSNAGIDPFSKRDVSFEKLSSKFTKGAQTLKEWKEYAFKAEDRIRELESQLEKQQPEFPEVPEFVAEWLDRKPSYAINGSIPVEIIEWSKKQTGYADLGMNINHLLKLKLNGYTVKEKQFYLKNKLTGFYLYKAFGGKYGEESGRYGTEDFGKDFKFTQQEIDSMATDSYEQIEVEE